MAVHTSITATQLSIGYIQKKKHTQIASNLNFSLEEGQLIALIGPNGAGKSTLIKTLSGLQPKLQGNITLGKKEMEHYTALELASQLSVVLTESPASKNLTVLELVSLGRQPYTNWMGNMSAKDLAIIKHALAITDLASLQNRHCYELSDGQLQRVYIARAIAQDTPIIILDEPTTHLDIYHSAYIVKLLKKLSQEKNKTILFSTHGIDLALQLADVMMVLTKNSFHMGSPENMISEGHIDNLFPKDTITFNKETRSFDIQ